MTLTIMHFQKPDGTWIARCEAHKGWKHKSKTYDREGAASSLRWHHAETLMFSHWGRP